MPSAEGFLLSWRLRLADELILLLVSPRVNDRRFVSLYLKLNRVPRLHLRLGFLLAGDLVRGGSVVLDVVHDPLPNFIFLLLIGGVLPLHDLAGLESVSGHDKARQQKRYQKRGSNLPHDVSKRG